ncbi:MAG: MMPL family transporter [Candidatus Eutrophobiaceae bacterium]
MAHSFATWLSSAIASLLRRRTVALLCFALIAVLAGIYAWTHLRINVDSKDMLAEHLEWRQMDLLHDRLFPEYNDNILIAIEGDVPDEVADAAQRLYQSVMEDPRTPFLSVFHPQSMPWFRHAAFMHKDTDQLYELSDRLASVQAPLGLLLHDFSLRGLSDMLVGAIDSGKQEELNPLVAEMARALGSGRRVSWRSLLYDEPIEPNQVFRELLLVRIKPNFSGFFPAGEAIRYLRDKAADLQLEDRYRIRVRLGGGVVMAHEELQSVGNANWRSIVFSLLMVAGLLLWNLGLRITLSCVATLCCGLLLVTAWALFTVGQFNLISVVFAILYVGLGIDFVIHYSLRAREFRRHSEDPQIILEQTSRSMSLPLLVCCLTTSCGFFAFMVTDYKGVAELGWIAGCGMFASFLLAFTLLPTLLSMCPLQPLPLPGQGWGSGYFHGLSPLRHPRTYAGIAVLLCCLTLPQLSDLRLDTDAVVLRDPQSGAVRLYRDLLEENAEDTLTLDAMVKGREQAANVAARIAALPEVDKVVWLADFMPGESSEKRGIIDEMGLLLGDIESPKALVEGVPLAQEISALRLLLAYIEETRLLQWQALAEQLRRKLAAADLAVIDPLYGLRDALLGNFPGRIAELADALNAHGIGEADLPAELEARWRNGEYYQIKVYAAEDMQDAQARIHFVQQVRQEYPKVIGTPLIEYEAGRVVGRAFVQAFALAFACIAVLLAILLRSMLDSALILFTLLMGACLTLGGMQALGLPLNFANIIVLPLLLGIGVDSGIHIRHQYRTLDRSQHFFAGVSVRGVILSSLTTLLSVGSLGFSAHQGTASMGWMLAAGLAIVVSCMLFVLPALLALADRWTRP